MVIETQRPVSAHDAQQLGRTLAAYKISLKNVKLMHLYVDGKEGIWHKAKDPALANAEDLAGATAIATPIGLGAGAALPAAAPAVAVALTNPLVFIAVMAADLALLAATLKAKYEMYKRSKGGMMMFFAEGYPVRSRIEFQWSNVSAKRQQWAEYLVGAWVSHPEIGLKDAGGFTTNQFAVGLRRHGNMPTPWAAKKGRR